MNPWFFFWAPQLTMPFGGSVAQRIEPDTRWFFGGISPELTCSITSAQWWLSAPNLKSRES